MLHYVNVRVSYMEQVAFAVSTIAVEYQFGMLLRAKGVKFPTIMPRHNEVPIGSWSITQDPCTQSYKIRQVARLPKND